MIHNRVQTVKIIHVCLGMQHSFGIRVLYLKVLYFAKKLVWLQRLCKLHISECQCVI
jgi:hypothetical protein